MTEEDDIGLVGGVNRYDLSREERINNSIIEIDEWKEYIKKARGYVVVICVETMEGNAKTLINSSSNETTRLNLYKLIVEKIKYSTTEIFKRLDKGEHD